MSKEEFVSWMKMQRGYYNLTLDDLTQEVRRRGYSVSINKLWRLENGKLRKIDYELRIRLEAIFDEKTQQGREKQRNEAFLLYDDVMELIDRIAKEGELSDLLQNPYLRNVYQKLMNYFDIKGTELASVSVQRQEGRHGRAT